MKNQLYLKLAIICGCLVAGVATMNAQATRTWVSGVGDDANPCSRTAPCKTFAGAISKTAEGGEIDALDPGGFGTVTITKAMTIDGTHGAGFGSILNAGNIAGVIVNITTGTHVNDAVVILRSLYIQGASQSPSGTGSSSNGINYLKGFRLFVNDCHIENQGNAGINASLTTVGALFVRDCDFTNVNNAIKGTDTVSSLGMDVANISVFNCTNGVVYTANSDGTVTNSYFFKNIGGNSVSGGVGCLVNVTHCSFRANTTAINAVAGSTVRIHDNEMFNNGNALAGDAASFQTASDNKQAGNGATVNPAGTAIATQ